MFNNIGNKLKTTASVFFWVGFIFSIVYGIVTMVGTNLLLDEVSSLGELSEAWDSDIEDSLQAVQGVYGLIRMGIGIFLSWLISALLYGFGQLIENTAPPKSLPAAAPKAPIDTVAVQSADATSAGAEKAKKWKCVHCGIYVTGTTCPQCHFVKQ